jgi:hypothetical protein
MTIALRICCLAFAAAVLLLGAGCDLDGKVTIDFPLDFGEGTPPVGDPGGGGDGGNGGGGGGGIPPIGGGGGGGGGGGTTETFDGTWIAGFSDNLATGGARQSYGLRVTLNQTGTSITGTGRMLRFFQSGAVANDFPAFNITLSGTVANDRATITIASTGGQFDNNPEWVLLAVGNRLVGIYAEEDGFSGDVQRLGYSIWHRSVTSAFSGEWVSAYMDAGANVDGMQVLTDELISRTGRLSLMQAGTNLTGGGSLVEQASGPVSGVTDFDLTVGTISNNLGGVTFGDLIDDMVGPVAGEIDWVLISNGSVMVGAYGEFNDADGLVRLGHATWRASTASDPSAINANWITAVEDTTADGADNEVNYLMTANLTAGGGGTVTGTAMVLDETDVNPMFVNYSVENGSILGNQVAFDLVSPGGERFAWTCRLTGSVLVGSYQHTDSGDNFISHGKGEWRFGSSTGLIGTWAASYFDTFTASAVEDRTAQLARIVINTAVTGGALSGTGSVRLINEAAPRTFNISGNVTATRIQMIWSGGDLFGDTEWNLHKAGNFLFGTFTNFDTMGDIEFQGFAVFERSVV